MTATYWDVANGLPLWILVGAGLAFVALLAAAFLVKAWKRCLSLGMEKSTLVKVVKSTLVFTIVPSIAMLIGLLTLASVLGVPWSWFRLSIVGSTSYELMAADIVSTGVGYTSLIEARNADASIMVAVMLVMSIGIIGGIIVNTFASKKITTTMTTYTKKNSAWGAVFSSCFMMTMMAVFVPMQFRKGLVAMLVIATSLIITVLLSTLAKIFKAKWMDEFIMAFSLIFGMASSLIWERLVG